MSETHQKIHIFKSINTKISTLIIVLVFFISFITSIIYGYHAKSREEIKTGKLYADLALKITNEIDRNIYNALRDLDTFTYIDILTNENISYTQKRDLLVGLIGSYKYFSSISIVDVNKNTIVSSSNTEQSKHFKVEKEFIINENKYYFIGYLSSNLQNFESFSDQTKSFHIDIVDKNNIKLNTNETTNIPKTISDKAETGNNSYSIVSIGEFKYLIGYSRSRTENTDFKVFVFEKTDNIFAEINQSQFLIIGFTTLMAIILAAIIWLVSHRYIKPINEISHILNNDEDISKIKKYKRPIELRNLSNSILFFTKQSKEINQLNRVMIDRELKMIELKDEIKLLKGKMTLV